MKRTLITLFIVTILLLFMYLPIYTGHATIPSKINKSNLSNLMRNILSYWLSMFKDMSFAMKKVLVKYLSKE